MFRKGEGKSRTTKKVEFIKIWMCSTLNQNFTLRIKDIIGHANDIRSLAENDLAGIFFYSLQQISLKFATF